MKSIPLMLLFKKILRVKLLIQLRLMQILQEMLPRIALKLENQLIIKIVGFIGLKPNVCLKLLESTVILIIIIRTSMPILDTKRKKRPALILLKINFQFKKLVVN
jgi:hypothetical protein